nr:hypothetical protein [uncultured Campylobacter sp.]
MELADGRLAAVWHTTAHAPCCGFARLKILRVLKFKILIHTEEFCTAKFKILKLKFRALKFYALTFRILKFRDRNLTRLKFEILLRF